MKNRILVLFVLIAIVFQSVPYITYANDDNAKYNEAVSFLEQIFEDVLFEDSTHVITRGEIVAKLYGMENKNAVWTGASYFTDVSPGDVYFNYINCAAAQGWISKAEKFNPGSGINGIDALKIMVCAFGYKTVADSLGGYPDGYMAFAQKSKILDGISFKQDGYITAKEFTVMLYNFLFADAYDISITTVSGAVDSMSLSKSEMLNLEKVFRIKYITGIITETRYTSLVQDTLISTTPSICIDGYKYDSLASYGEKYLGLNVDAFYREEKGVKKIIALTPIGNEEVTLSIEDYSDISNEFIYYESDNKTKKFKLSNNCKYVYNGRRANTFEDTFVDSGVGQFRLIDNNGDKRYDVVFIDEYEYYTVESVDTALKTIGLIDYGSLEIKETDYFKCMDIDANPIDLIEIGANDVIAAKVSEDKLVKIIVLLDEQISGKIESVSTEEREIEIGNKIYKFSKNFEKNDLPLITLGTELVAVLGLEGDIALKAMAVNDYKYGYLISIPEPERKEDINVQIFTPYNKTEIYALADKVVINGEKSIEKTYVKSKLTQMSYSYGLIKYRLSNEGKIKAIDTPEEAYNVSNITDNNSLVKYAQDTELYYRSGPRAFVELANISNAVIFSVPATYSDDEDDYGLVYINELVSSKRYKVDVYDIDNYGYAKAVVIKGEPDIKQNFKSYLIERVGKCLNADGYETYFLEVWSGGVKNKYVAKPDVSVTKSSGKQLDIGDIARMRIVDGEVVQIIADIDMNTGTAVLDSSTNLTLNAAPATSYYAAGYVYSASGGLLNVVDTPIFAGDIYPVADSTHLISADNGTYYYKINKKHKIITASSVNDIHSSLGYGLDSHYIVARMTSDMSDEIYIYE